MFGSLLVSSKAQPIQKSAWSARRPEESVTFLSSPETNLPVSTEPTIFGTRSEESVSVLSNPNRHFSMPMSSITNPPAEKKEEPIESVSTEGKMTPQAAPLFSFKSTVLTDTVPVSESKPIPMVVYPVDQGSVDVLEQPEKTKETIETNDTKETHEQIIARLEELNHRDQVTRQKLAKLSEQLVELHNLADYVRLALKRLEEAKEKPKDETPLPPQVDEPLKEAQEETKAQDDDKQLASEAEEEKVVKMNNENNEVDVPVDVLTSEQQEDLRYNEYHRNRRTMCKFMTGFLCLLSSPVVVSVVQSYFDNYSSLSDISSTSPSLQFGETQIFK